MPYKIPALPGVKAYKEEKADFWEVQAIRCPGLFVSNIQISKVLARGLDEISNEGLEDENDELNSNLDDVLLELQNRPKYCSHGYPFTFNKFSIKLDENESDLKKVYLFLLLCTRFNMKTNKIHGRVDGTLLFERLCTHVAKNYFGSNSQSFVFGTAKPCNFETKVRDMISKIGEGNSFKNPNHNPPTKKDDSIDVVAWKEFSDARIGKLIAFGQCKTGTSNWREDKHKLKPRDFCTKWFQEEPVLPPLPLVFICDTMNENRNFWTDQQGYLIFNRFRILEYTVTDDLDESFMRDLNSWLDNALPTLDIKD